ncbi:MAG TPA: sensor domain-containing diguanylate cyclase [Candidatus Eisenbacteria bacterium]
MQQGTERRILIRTLHRIAELMAGDRDLERIQAAVLDGALELFGAETAFLLIREGEGDLRLARRRANIDQTSGLEAERFASSMFLTTLLSGRKPLTVADPANLSSLGLGGIGFGESSPRNLVAVPFLARGNNQGALVVVNGLRLEHGNDEAMDLLAVLANQAAVAAETFRLNRRLEQLAITDELTQVYNYRFLKTALRKEVKRAGRFGHEFAILMIDVDNLKKYNEKNGHLRGSELLRKVGRQLLDNSRAADLVAKYGGDEFLIILPLTGSEGAAIMGERVRKAVAETAFVNAEPGVITISIGVAVFPGHGRSVEDLIASADEALFRAKRGGRNCVQAAPPERQAA